MGSKRTCIEALDDWVLGRMLLLVALGWRDAGGISVAGEERV